MKKSERNKLIYQYFKTKNYDSSSQFVIDFYNFDLEMAEKAFLACAVEKYLSSAESSEQAILKFRQVIAQLSISACKELHKSYTSILDEFCENYELYKRFKLDEFDEEGWKIYKELSSKTAALFDAVQFMKYRKVPYEY